MAVHFNFSHFHLVSTYPNLRAYSVTSHPFRQVRVPRLPIIAFLPRSPKLNFNYVNLKFRENDRFNVFQYMVINLSHPKFTTLLRQQYSVVSCHDAESRSSVDISPMSSFIAFGIEKRHKPNNDIDGKQQGTLEIVTPPIQYQKVDNERRDEKADRFKHGKVQTHILLHGPAKHHHNGRDEEAYLDG